MHHDKLPMDPKLEDNNVLEFPKIEASDDVQVILTAKEAKALACISESAAKEKAEQRRILDKIAKLAGCSGFDLNPLIKPEEH